MSNFLPSCFVISRLLSTAYQLLINKRYPRDEAGEPALLVLVQISADFSLGPAGFDVSEPVFGHFRLLAGDDFHHVAVIEFVGELDHLAIHPRASGFEPEVSVHGKSEIERRGALGD